MGPDATGITPAERSGTDNGTGIGPPPSHRRRRVLLSAIIVLAFVAAGLVWANFLREDPDSPTVTPPVQSELIAPDDPTQADPAGVIDATGTATRTARGPVVSAATEEATEATSTPRRTTPTAGATASDTATDEPATEATDEAPSDTPTGDETATATDTVTPLPTRTAIVAGEDGTPDPPDVRLIYEPDGFILLNVTGEPIDVSDLVFEQSGTTRYFEGSEWEGFVSGSPAYLEADNCLQLVPNSVTRPEPDEDTCPRLAGYYQTSVSRRYFWRSDDADASFTVRLGETTLATCSIAAGECSFSLPEP